MSNSYLIFLSYSSIQLETFSGPMSKLLAFSLCTSSFLCFLQWMCHLLGFIKINEEVAEWFWYILAGLFPSVKTLRLVFFSKRNPMQKKKKPFTCFSGTLVFTYKLVKTVQIFTLFVLFFRLNADWDKILQIFSLLKIVLFPQHTLPDHKIFNN